MLLAMSTLPRGRSDDEPVQISRFSFTYEGSVIENCYSQLEPIAALMLERCRGDIEFIILCSPETKEKRTFILQNEGPYVLQMSAAELFEQRIQNRAEGRTVHFTEIPLDVSNPTPCIKTVADEIRRKYSREGEFWINASGGLRSIYQVLSATVFLLKVDGIIPDYILGTETQNKRIIDQKNAFDIFSFVSGMEDFINFGDASVLRRYYANSKNKSVQSLIGAMDRVSEGIWLCDIDEYQSGLQDLRYAISGIDREDTLLSIFSDYIRRDYGRILEDSRSPVWLIVKRCVDKRLYQQALTFAESKMVAEMSQRQFLVFDTQERGFNELRKLQKKEKNTEDPNDFCIEQYINLCTCYYEYDTDVYQSVPEWKRKRDNANAVEFIRELSQHQDELMNALEDARRTGVYTFPESVYAVTDFFREGEVSSADFEVTRNGQSSCITMHLYTKIPTAKIDAAGLFLRMHKALKRCRNYFNHGNSEDRPVKKQIITLLNLYTEYAQYVMDE